MADAIYKDDAKFGMFRRLPVDSSVFYLRVLWDGKRLSWLGPWASRDKALDAARTMRFRRCQSLFTVKLTKKDKTNAS